LQDGVGREAAKGGRTQQFETKRISCLLRILQYQRGLLRRKKMNEERTPFRRKIEDHSLSRGKENTSNRKFHEGKKEVARGDTKKDVPNGNRSRPQWGTKRA